MRRILLSFLFLPVLAAVAPAQQVVGRDQEVFTTSEPVARGEWFRFVAFQGEITPTTMRGLKDWIKDGNTKKPFAGQVDKFGGRQELFQPAPPVGSPQFKRWFGDSKVVDAEGKPLVVYHGGPRGIEAFNPSKIGSHYELDDEGFFFTSDGKSNVPGSAPDYASKFEDGDSGSPMV